MYDGPPVVVVGNGPVGQTTALLLARWGIPVLVLDTAPHRVAAGSRSICQQRDVLDIWDAVGAGRRIAAEGVTWRVARTFFREHELFHVAVTLERCDDDARAGLPARWTPPAAHDAAVRNAPVTARRRSARLASRS